MTLQTDDLIMHEQPVTDDASQSPTIPSRFYTDPNVLDLEREQIFSREWVFVGHVSELVSPGDYVVRKLYKESIAVVRGQDDKIRAFFNVCPHRGHEILSGKGNKKRLVCPNHAWTFHIDGSLFKAPKTENLDNFDADKFCLKPVRVETIAGFIFVCTSQDVPALSDRFPGLEEGLLSQFPALNELEPLEDFSLPIDSNWKVAIDNYLECYHCQIAHPTFRTIFEYDKYTYEYFDSHIKMSAPAKHGDSTAYKVDPELYPKNLFFWYLWPNIVINLFPGTNQIMFMSFDPDSADRSEVLIKSYSAGKKLEDYDGFVNLGRTVFQEDKDLCESIQRGMHSRGFDQGMFVVDDGKEEATEEAVHYFHKKVWDRLKASGSND